MLEERDKSEVKMGRLRTRENFHFARRTIEEFVDSGYECALVTGWPKPIQATTQASYLSNAIRDLKHKNEIVARNRKTGVYLVWIGDEE